MEDQAPEVERQLRALYGEAQLLLEGVVHVTSAVRGERGALRVIAIGEHAPRSETDFFVLNLCRARCDALLTTAAILRSEPRLVHTLQGPHATALAAYRRDVLGKLEPPCCALMTRSAVLPLAHPVWDDGTPKLVLTTHEAAAELTASLGTRAEVVALDALDARTAVALLQARGAALVSIEAGPSTTGPLYETPAVVDELLLSLCESASDVQLGGQLTERLLLERTCLTDVPRHEISGPWRFQRWLRKRA